MRTATRRKIIGVIAAFLPFMDCAFGQSAKPVLTITSPKTSARWSNSVISVQGKVTSKIAIQSVQWRVNGGAWSSAIGTTNWSAQATLAPGTNTVFAYAVDAATNRSATNSASVFYSVPATITLRTNGLGSITASFKGATLEQAGGYTVTAKASAGQLFSVWTGSINSTNNPLVFVMQPNMVLQANFIPNPFLPVKGVYNGLFYPTNSKFEATNSGGFALTLADSGAFTGKLLGGTASIPFTGAFNLSGNAAVLVANSALGPVQLNLELDASSKTISGWVAGPNWQAQVFCGMPPTSNFFTGSYTLLASGSSDNRIAPSGFGAGTVRIDAKGAIKVSATLADGTPISPTATLLSNGQWPLYVSLYGGKGRFLGWMRNNSISPVAWIKPPAPKDKFYTNGFSAQAQTVIAKYTAPGKYQSAVGWTNGVVTISGGNLATALESQITLASNKVKVTSGTISNLSFNIKVADGTFTGAFIHPATKKSVTFKGAILQDSNGIYMVPSGGWFSGTNQGGKIIIDRKLAAPVATAASDISAIGFTANWNPVVGAREYRLDIAAKPDFSVFKLQDISAGLATSYVVNGLTPGTVYYYRVRSVAGGTVTTNSDFIIASTLAPTLVVPQTTIDPAGGTVTTPSGSPIAGMVINVPSGSYSDANTLAVGYSTIPASTLPVSATPITPLIHIDNGGQSASQIMTISVPITLDPGDIPVVLGYRPETGKWQGLTVSAMDSNSVTLATRKFTDFIIQKRTITELSNLVASVSVSRSSLMRASPHVESASVERSWLDSGFRLGVDNWDFPNYGTFPSPGGDCEGMSQTSMWYYVNKRWGSWYAWHNTPPEGAPDEDSLFNRFDNSLYSFKTPNYPDDNVLGFRFASEVQPKTGTYWEHYKDVFAREITPGFLTFAQVVHAIEATGEPQLLWLDGHAILTYKVDKGGIWIADPNYPRNQGVIPFNYETFKLGPYVNPDMEVYTNVGYIDKESVADWDSIPPLWSLVENQTIGNGDFPVYRISIQEKNKDGAWQAARQVYTGDVRPDMTVQLVHGNTNKILVEQSAGPMSYNTSWRIVDASGTSVGNGSPSSLGRAGVRLKLGPNRFGIRIFSAPDDHSGTGWAAFRWVDVTGTPAALPATEVLTNGFTAHWEGLDGADGYAIDVSESEDFNGFVYQDYQIGNTNVTFSGQKFKPNNRYYYRVRAHGASQVSENSFAVGVTLPATPVPTGMMLIPEGEFQMGDALNDDSDLLVHTVFLSAFYMDETLVTKALWDEVYSWAIAHGYGFDLLVRGRRPITRWRILIGMMR